MLRFQLITATFLAIAAASQTGAQSLSTDDVPKVERLVPLTEYLAQPPDRIIEHYAFLRCAGLFLGHRYYTGATYDAEAEERSQAAISAFQKRAAYGLAKGKGKPIETFTDQEVDELLEATQLQIVGIAFFYDDRMKANYLSDGEAFGKDRLISGDFEVCGEIGRAIAY